MGGLSLNAWRDYFSSPNLILGIKYGIEVQENMTAYNMDDVKRIAEADQSSPVDLDRLIEEYGNAPKDADGNHCIPDIDKWSNLTGWDIILDDASHFPKFQ